jgi:ATP-dependent helicase YprA (DUF1998 family)
VCWALRSHLKVRRPDVHRPAADGDPEVFARYAGQETQLEREAIRANPPDILLTNFMMLELLITRQTELDRAVIQNCQGLRFLVLDELHTYRGRQGADVRCLFVVYGSELRTRPSSA